MRIERPTSNVELPTSNGQEELPHAFDLEERLLETGGSVKNALPLLGEAAFFVLNGDGLWQDGRVPMLARMEANWDPARMDALLLLHPLDVAELLADRLGADGRGVDHVAAGACLDLVAQRRALADGRGREMR